MPDDEQWPSPDAGTLAERSSARCRSQSYVSREAEARRLTRPGSAGKIGEHLSLDGRERRRRWDGSSDSSTSSGNRPRPHPGLGWPNDCTASASRAEPLNAKRCGFAAATSSATGSSKIRFALCPKALGEGMAERKRCRGQQVHGGQSMKVPVPAGAGHTRPQPRPLKVDQLLLRVRAWGASSCRNTGGQVWRS
jgi:hypothetical protein